MCSIENSGRRASQDRVAHSASSPFSVASRLQLSFRWNDAGEHRERPGPSTLSNFTRKSGLLETRLAVFPLLLPQWRRIDEEDRRGGRCRRYREKRRGSLFPVARARRKINAPTKVLRAGDHLPAKDPPCVHRLWCIALVLRPLRLDFALT